MKNSVRKTNSVNKATSQIISECENWKSRSSPKTFTNNFRILLLILLTVFIYTAHTLIGVCNAETTAKTADPTAARVTADYGGQTPLPTLRRMGHTRYQIQDANRYYEKEILNRTHKIENLLYSIKNDRLSNKIVKFKMFSWPEREKRLKFKTWHTNIKNIQ